MRLKQRIEKLEEKIINVNGGFCDCPGVPKYEIRQADLSINSNTTESILTGSPVPDICPECRRPINKHVIILQLCDKTTASRFPDQWNREVKQ